MHMGLSQEGCVQLNIAVLSAYTCHIQLCMTYCDSPFFCFM